jgi:transposase InsO family protein
MMPRDFVGMVLQQVLDSAKDHQVCLRSNVIVDRASQLGAESKQAELMQPLGGHKFQTQQLLPTSDLSTNLGERPEIFNTDQGSQFTSQEWTGALEDLGVKISMDGKGRWMDNVFIERLWRSVKYEEIYIREHATIPALSAGLQRWFQRYNTWRPHQALGNRTPAEIYKLREADEREGGDLQAA